MKIRKRGWLFNTLGFLIVTGLFAAGTGLSFAKDQSNWRFYMYTPPGHHYTRIMKEMSADIAAQTQDKLKITVVTAGEVPYNPTQVLDIVRGRLCRRGRSRARFRGREPSHPEPHQSADALYQPGRVKNRNEAI